MLELLFLLLPVAAVYGWYMGRRSTQQHNQQNANRLSREYVTGVNFLLSDQQDKAVDLFLGMLEKDSTTVEAHLTLGDLFRSRGEIERAIRIHQTLMESTSLTFEQRSLTIQQLGRDYMAAGLYDRAEDMFTQLVAEDDFCLMALEQLLIIYQATSDWLNAIDVADKLSKRGKKYQTEIAHFYCELALQAVSHDNFYKATHLLKKAALADDHCARVSIMRGRILMAQSKFTEAATLFERVLQQDKEMVSEMLPMLHDCYKKNQQTEAWGHFLRRCVEENTGAVAELMLADLTEDQDGCDMAQLYLHRQLQLHPTMRVFNRFMDYHLRDAEEGRAKESLLLLRDMVGEQIRTKPHYRCHKCGFTAHSLYWHCPSCKVWASVKPIRGLDGQ